MKSKFLSRHFMFAATGLLLLVAASACTKEPIGPTADVTVYLSPT